MPESGQSNGSYNPPGSDDGQDLPEKNNKAAKLRALMMMNPEFAKAMGQLDQPVFGALPNVTGDPTLVIGSMQPQPPPRQDGIPGSYSYPGSGQADPNEPALLSAPPPGVQNKSSQANAWTKEVGHGSDPVSASSMQLPPMQGPWTRQITTQPIDVTQPANGQTIPVPGVSPQPSANPLFDLLLQRMRQQNSGQTQQTQAAPYSGSGPT
jgi:hypothetical protein